MKKKCVLINSLCKQLLYQVIFTYTFLKTARIIFHRATYILRYEDPHLWILFTHSSCLCLDQSTSSSPSFICFSFTSYPSQTYKKKSIIQDKILMFIDDSSLICKSIRGNIRRKMYFNHGGDFNWMLATSWTEIRYHYVAFRTAVYRLDNVYQSIY